MPNTCRLCRLPKSLREILATALFRVPTLTDRERQILGLLVFAEEYSELARSLGIAERTVKFHVANLRTKLGGLSRLQLCQVALLDLTGLLDTVEICGAHPAR